MKVYSIKENGLYVMKLKFNIKERLTKYYENFKNKS